MHSRITHGAQAVDFESYRYFVATEAPLYYPEEYEFPQRGSRPKGASRTKTKTRRVGRLWFYVMMMGVSLAICGTLVVMNAVRIAEAKTRSNALIQEISSLRDQNAEKLNAYESATDIEYIRQVASEKLGMKNPTPDKFVVMDIAAIKPVQLENKAVEIQDLDVQHQSTDPSDPPKPKFNRPYRSIFSSIRGGIDVDLENLD